MVLIRITVLLLFFASSLAIPSGYVDRHEQQIIDHLLLHSSGSKSHSAPAAPISDELPDELEREQLSLVNEQDLRKADESKNSEQYQLIKKAAVAVVKRLSMPSPPKTDALIDKAVQFVLKKSMSKEYAKIRSGIKELVDELLFEGEHRNKPELPKHRTSVLREEKILTALEVILSELAIQLNLTTVQIKSVVNTSVDVLAKHFGLKPWQNHHLHERVSSHVRAKLDYQDLDNKDARLRKLEEKINMDIKHLKLDAEQSKRLEALMVEAEALREGLSRKERLRMFKRVIADIKDDFKTEKEEQESAPPKLTSVNMISIKNLVREKAAEMQLRKAELKVLALAVLTAFDKLSMHTSPTTKTQGTQPTKATLQDISTKAAVAPTTVRHKISSEAATKHTEPKTEVTLKTSTENPRTEDEIEEELLEGTHRPETHLPEHTTRSATTHAYKTTPSFEQTSSKELEHEITAMTKIHEATTHKPETRKKAEVSESEEDDLDAKLAADEAELEGKATDKASNSKVEDERKAEELELELERKDLLDKEPKKTENPTVKVTMTNPTHVTKSATSPKTVSKATTAVKGESKTIPIIVTEVTKPTKAVHVTHSVPSSEEFNKKLEEDLLEGRHVTMPTTSHPKEATQHQTKRVDRVTISTSRAKEEVTQPKTEHVTHSVPSSEEFNKKLEEDLLEGRVIMPTTSPPKEATQHQTKRVDRVTIPTSRAKEEVTQPKTEHVTTSTEEKELASELNIVAEKGVHSRRHRVKITEDEAEMEDLKSEKNKKEDEVAFEDADLSLSGKPKPDESFEDELNEILAQKDAVKGNHSLEDELKDLSYG